MKDQRQSRQSRRPERQSEFDSKLVDLARVTRVSKGGRRFRFRALVVAGDKKSRVGIGIAKGLDVSQAIEKATRKAEKQLIMVPLQDGTIPHEVQARFGSSEVLLKPQVKGRGLVAGGVTRIICEKAGVKDISAKVLTRSRNKLNNAMATLKAFKMLREKQAPKKEAKENLAEVEPVVS